MPRINNKVCVDCRISARAWNSKCPECGKPLTEIGEKRRIPKKTDGKGWKEFIKFVNEIKTKRSRYDYSRMIGNIKREMGLSYEAAPRG